MEECNLGNLIADAMRWESGAQISLMNGGGVRANIEIGDITAGELLTVQPFNNLIATFDATGADVLAALEHSVAAIQVENGMIVRGGASGRFMQVSGLRFSYDPTMEPGSRVVAISPITLVVDPENPRITALNVEMSPR